MSDEQDASPLLPRTPLFISGVTGEAQDHGQHKLLQNGLPHEAGPCTSHENPTSDT